jgi:ABC-type uncharacterized transport system substrate-binding protein
MRRAILSLCLFLCVLCTASAASATAQDGARGPAHILLVHSYHPQYVWSRHISDGVRQALQGSKATLETVYLDAKRDPDPERLRARAMAIFARIEAEKPQVVIAADDAAQEYLVAPYLKGRAAPQVIFCGVNAPLAHYGFPAANVSGVRALWHFREGFALLKRIDPKLRRVAVLFDDSETGGYLLNDLREDAKAGPFALKLIGAETIHTFQQWQHRVEYYQRRADALAFGLYHSLVDETTGQVVPAETVIAWSNAANRLPTLGFADFAKEHGMLCGVLGSGLEQGQLAGTMARQVLERGVNACALPVRRNQKGEVLVNLKTAQRLGIDIPYAIIDAAGFVIK